MSFPISTWGHTHTRVTTTDVREFTVAWFVSILRTLSLCDYSLRLTYTQIQNIGIFKGITSQLS